MALIAKAAYFKLCDCGSKPPHGTIHCADDTRVTCYEKVDAREAVNQLWHAKRITEEEKKVLRDQIDASPIPLACDQPVVVLIAGTRAEEHVALSIGIDGLMGSLEESQQPNPDTRH